MMSPLSVSQFLPGDMTFDVVIFDEASQVLPSDAINCIYRGGAADRGRRREAAAADVVLRPGGQRRRRRRGGSTSSSRCSTSCKSAHAVAAADLALPQPARVADHLLQLPLLRDGDALQTFPGATFEAPDLGVESYVVNGVYRRGDGTRQPDRGRRGRRPAGLPPRSTTPTCRIGVVTFSAAQESAIAAALEQRSAGRARPRRAARRPRSPHGFFVKNLENVQGDERDIIIFSVGYGPDEHGKFTMNFGPLNREGGWRRLNVAITRARRRVEVVSSFRASDIREGDNRERRRT